MNHAKTECTETHATQGAKMQSRRHPIRRPLLADAPRAFAPFVALHARRGLARVSRALWDHVHSFLGQYSLPEYVNLMKALENICLKMRAQLSLGSKPLV